MKQKGIGDSARGGPLCKVIAVRLACLLSLWLLPALGSADDVEVIEAGEAQRQQIEAILQRERARAEAGLQGDDAATAGHSGEDAEPARRYITREERRDEGHRYEITEWLSLAGIAEAEYEREELTNREDRDRELASEPGLSVEAVVEITPLDWLKAELVYEYDNETDDIRVDEAILSLEYADVELEAGELFVPFGEYFSHFVSGPVIEFAETQGRAVSLSYAPGDWLDVKLFAYEGLARKDTESGDEFNWGAALEIAPLDFATFGMSYLSDLADAEEELLEDEGNRYSRQVDAISGYALLGFDWIEWSLEIVHSLDTFAELDSNQNKPSAWNSELAWFPTDSLGLALRLERSRELEDEPRRRAGVAVMWQVMQRVFLTVEYLEGEFEPGLAEDSQEREAKDQRLYGAQLSIEL